jgi:hypothetical protein
VGFGDRSGLGAALGKRPVAAVAVTHPSFAQQILAELHDASEIALTGVEG